MGDRPRARAVTVSRALPPAGRPPVRAVADGRAAFSAGRPPIPEPSGAGPPLAESLPCGAHGWGRARERAAVRTARTGSRSARAGPRAMAGRSPGGAPPTPDETIHPPCATLVSHRGHRSSVKLLTISKGPTALALPRPFCPGAPLNAGLRVSVSLGGRSPRFRRRGCGLGRSERSRDRCTPVTRAGNAVWPRETRGYRRVPFTFGHGMFTKRQVLCPLHRSPGGVFPSTAEPGS